MNYEVGWTSDAEDDLAALWNAATDRNAVTHSAHQLDIEIATDPLHFG